MRDERIDFRPVEIGRDLPDLLRWLGDPEVRRWYDEGELSEANIGRKFAPESHMRKLVILIDEVPVGYIQIYRLADEEDYRRQVDVAPEEVGKEFQTADRAKEAARAGYWLCVGVAGEPWFQTLEKIESKYESYCDEFNQFSFDR